jgi:hypothetical protein
MEDKRKHKRKCRRNSGEKVTKKTGISEVLFGKTIGIAEGDRTPFQKGRMGQRIDSQIEDCPLSRPGSPGGKAQISIDIPLSAACVKGNVKQEGSKRKEPSGPSVKDRKEIRSVRRIVKAADQVDEIFAGIGGQGLHKKSPETLFCAPGKDLMFLAYEKHQR